MSVYLSTVKDVFEISGRGLVVAPGMSKDGPKIRIGDAVILELPDGSKLMTTIKGIEFVRFSVPVPSHREVALLLGSGLTKGMVPVGTKLWVTKHASDDE